MPTFEEITTTSRKSLAAPLRPVGVKSRSARCPAPSPLGPARVTSLPVDLLPRTPSASRLLPLPVVVVAAAAAAAAAEAAGGGQRIGRRRRRRLRRRRRERSGTREREEASEERAVRAQPRPPFRPPEEPEQLGPPSAVAPPPPPACPPAGQSPRARAQSHVLVRRQRPPA